MSKKQFDQQQKVVIVENAKEIGVKEASKIAGVHYTTVYEWSREVEAIGKEAFLAHETTRVGRGIKEISEKQEQLVLDTWRANPGYGPGQIRNQLRDDEYNKINLKRYKFHGEWNYNISPNKVVKVIS